MKLILMLPILESILGATTTTNKPAKYYSHSSKKASHHDKVVKTSSLDDDSFNSKVYKPIKDKGPSSSNHRDNPTNLKRPTAGDALFLDRLSSFYKPCTPSQKRLFEKRLDEYFACINWHSASHRRCRRKWRLLLEADKKCNGSISVRL